MAHIDPSSTIIRVAGAPQPAAPTAAKQHRNAFASVLRAVSKVAAAALPVIGPVVGAAVDAIGSHRATVVGPFRGKSETLQYLQLQRDIERETRAFETASNVLKARHDATMNAIRNLRS
jgi:hypothetical protein